MFSKIMRKTYCPHFGLCHLECHCVHAKDGYTALHVAAMTGQTEACSLLVERGADVEAKSNVSCVKSLFFV